MHPIMRTFLSLSPARLAKRYCHLHPEAKPDAVLGALSKVRRVRCPLHVLACVMRFHVRAEK